MGNWCSSNNTQYAGNQNYQPTIRQSLPVQKTNPQIEEEKMLLKAIQDDLDKLKAINNENSERVNEGKQKLFNLRAQNFSKSNQIMASLELFQRDKKGKLSLQSCLSINQINYIFVGASQTGKSTFLNQAFGFITSDQQITPTCSKVAMLGNQEGINFYQITLDAKELVNSPQKVSQYLIFKFAKKIFFFYEGSLKSHLSLLAIVWQSRGDDSKLVMVRSKADKFGVGMHRTLEEELAVDRQILAQRKITDIPPICAISMLTSSHQNHTLKNLILKE